MLTLTLSPIIHFSKIINLNVTLELHQSLLMRGSSDAENQRSTAVDMIVSEADAAVSRIRTPQRTLPVLTAVVSSSSSSCSEDEEESSKENFFQPRRLLLDDAGGSSPRKTPCSGGSAAPSSRTSLELFLAEANALLINRRANEAGFDANDQNIFKGWAEVRGRSKRFYSWRRRFISFNAVSRVLTLFDCHKMLHQRGSYIVTDADDPLRPGKSKKFWQRKFRLDLAVTEFSSPLSLNLYSSTKQKFWLRTFKRSNEDVDVTVDEADEGATKKFKARDVKSRAETNKLSGVKNQIAMLSNAAHAAVRANRCDRAEWRDFFFSQKRTPRPLSNAERAALLNSADYAVARLVDGRRERELSVFLSSCEHEFTIERALLNADVFPFLMQIGKLLGVEVNAPIDLTQLPLYYRDNHLIEKVRKCEITRCRENSIGYAYVQFFGTRYGPSVLPTTIPASAFDDIMSAMESYGHLEEVALLTTWYVLDENVVPACYMLAPISMYIPDFISSDNDKRDEAEGAWHKVVGKLERSLRMATAKNKDWAEIYETSDLHSEFKAGFLENPDESQCLAFIRNFKNAIDLKDTISLNFADVRVQGEGKRVFCIDHDKFRRLDSLKKSLHKSSAKIITQTIDDPRSLIEGKGENEYLQTFLDTYCSAMLQTLVEVAENNIHEKEPTPMEADVAAHVEIARSQNDNYFTLPFASIITSCLQYLDDRDNLHPFFVLGAIGSGKTFFMSHLLQKIKDAKQDSCSVLIRFVGRTHSSTTTLELLSSLCEQLGAILCQADEGFQSFELPHSLQALFNHFSILLGYFQHRNLVVLIDGVDELSCADPSKSSRFSWIPISLPRGVKFIISCSSNGGAQECRPARVANTVTLEPWNSDDVKGFLKLTLAKRNRNVTKAQLSHTLKCLGKSCTPLVAQLVLHEIALWPSYLDNIGSTLKNEPTWLIDGILNNLEGKVGQVVVRHTFGYIFCAFEKGLSTNEMLDVLSLDDDLLSYVFTPGGLKLQRRFPSVILSQILSDSEGDILVKRTAADGSKVWGFRHKTIRDEIGKRSKYIQHLLHKNLADYFSGKWSEGKIAPVPRYVAPQNLHDEQGNSNLRLIFELPHHLITCKEWKELGCFLSNLRVLDVVGHRGSSKIQIRAGTARSMLLFWWKSWEDAVEDGDICSVYMKSFRLWQRSHVPSVRDSNRRLKAVAYLLRDYCVEFSSKKYLKNTIDIFVTLKEREMQEFGDHHPAVNSTKKNIEALKALLNGERDRGDKENGCNVTMRTTTPEALAKRISRTPFPLSPIAKIPTPIKLSRVDP